MHQGQDLRARRPPDHLRGDGRRLSIPVNAGLKGGTHDPLWGIGELFLHLLPGRGGRLGIDPVFYGNTLIPNFVHGGLSLLLQLTLLVRNLGGFRFFDFYHSGWRWLGPVKDATPVV